MSPPEPFTYRCGMTPVPGSDDPETAREAGRQDAQRGIYNPCQYSDELFQVVYDEGWREIRPQRPGAIIPQCYARNLSWSERRRLALGMLIVKGRRNPTPY